MREFAIQFITAFAGGMIAVIFANFVRDVYIYLKRSDWEIW